jgi:hypothetical protein
MLHSSATTQMTTEPPLETDETQKIVKDLLQLLSNQTVPSRQVHVHYLLAKVFIATGRHSEAERHLTKAVGFHDHPYIFLATC